MTEGMQLKGSGHLWDWRRTILRCSRKDDLAKMDKTVNQNLVKLAK